ncbi:MAG: hypothetical protein WCP55_22885, partial [Lentisphaerota bacterium]
IPGFEAVDEDAVKQEKDDGKAAAEEANVEKEKAGSAERAVREEDNITKEKVDGTVFVTVETGGENVPLSEADKAQAIAAGGQPDGDGNPPQLVVIWSANAAQGLDDEEKRALVNNLKTRYTLANGKTLYVVLDGFSEGSVDSLGAVSRGTAKAWIYDDIAGRTLVTEVTQRKGLPAPLTQEGLNSLTDLSARGEKVYVRSVGSSHYLVTVSDDGTTYVRGLGDNVSKQTMNEILRAGNILAGNDEDSKKAGLGADDIEIGEKGIYVRNNTTGEPLLNFMSIIAGNLPAAEELERLPLTKETGKPELRLKDQGFLGKFTRYDITPKLQGAWDWVRWKFIALGRLQIGWGNKVEVGLPVYKARDAVRNFMMWGQKKTASFQRANNAARMKNGRTEWYQSWDNSIRENKGKGFVPALKRSVFQVRLFINLFPNYVFNFIANKLPVYYAVAAVGAVVMFAFRLPQLFLQALDAAKNKIKEFAKKAKDKVFEPKEKEPDIDKDKLLDARMPASFKNKFKEARDAVSEAKRITRVTLTSDEKTAAITKVENITVPSVTTPATNIERVEQ